jgi:hypothetical protein
MTETLSTTATNHIPSLEREGAQHPAALGIAPWPESSFVTERGSSLVITRVLLDDGDAAVVDLPRKGRPRVWCPFCGREGVYRKRVNASSFTEHFAHRNGQVCRPEDLSLALHRRAIELLVEWLGAQRQAGEGVAVQVDCRRCKQGLGVDLVGPGTWTEERVEVRVDWGESYRVPDILMVREGVPVAVIEVAHTSLVDEERRADLLSQGVPGVELDAWPVVEALTAGRGLPSLRQHWGLERAPRDFHVCRRCRKVPEEVELVARLVDSGERRRPGFDGAAEVGRVLELREGVGLRAVVARPEKLRVVDVDGAERFADRARIDESQLWALAEGALGWSLGGERGEGELLKLLRQPVEAVVRRLRERRSEEDWRPPGAGRWIDDWAVPYRRAVELDHWLGHRHVNSRGRLLVMTLEDARASAGHTAWTLDQLEAALVERDRALLGAAAGELALPEGAVRPVLRRLCQEGSLVCCREDGGSVLLASERLVGPLRSAARQIVEDWGGLARTKHGQRVSTAAPAALPPVPGGGQWSTEQGEALRMAATMRMAVITGGPGTGKTTLIRAIVEQGEGPWVVLAPTWKAVARVRESLGSVFESGLEVEILTVARFVSLTTGVLPKGQKRDDPKPGWAKGRRILVDEAGFLDTHTFSLLVQGAGPARQLLLVGDPDQLPSIGPGAVLRDLVAWGELPHVALQRVHRSSVETGIPGLAAELLRGRLAGEGPGVWMEDVGKEALVGRVLDWYAGARARVGVHEARVVTPVNWVRHKVNTLAQARFNRTGERVGPRVRVGDPVILNRSAEGIQKGELAVVVGAEGAGSAVLMVAGRGRLAVAVSAVELAYALTIHKAQGSEWKEVVVAVPPTRRAGFLSRQMLYTAVTRARDRVAVLGPRWVLERAAREDAVGGRMTVLRHVLEATAGRSTGW